MLAIAQFLEDACVVSVPSPQTTCFYIGGLQDDEDDRALRWKCRECGYISIIRLLQCVAQTCAVLQQKIDGPQKRPRTVIEFCKPNQTNGETTVFATIVRFRM